MPYIFVTSWTCYLILSFRVIVYFVGIQRREDRLWSSRKVLTVPPFFFQRILWLFSWHSWPPWWKRPWLLRGKHHGSCQLLFILYLSMNFPHFCPPSRLDPGFSFSFFICQFQNIYIWALCIGQTQFILWQQFKRFCIDLL